MPASARQAQRGSQRQTQSVSGCLSAWVLQPRAWPRDVLRAQWAQWIPDARHGKPTARLLTAERSGSIRRWAAAVRSLGGPVSRSRWQTWEIWRSKKPDFRKAGESCAARSCFTFVGGAGDSFPWPLLLSSLGGELTSLFHGCTTLLVGPVGLTRRPLIGSCYPNAPVFTCISESSSSMTCGLLEIFFRSFFCQQLSPSVSRVDLRARHYLAPLHKRSTVER